MPSLSQWCQSHSEGRRQIDEGELKGRRVKQEDAVLAPVRPVDETRQDRADHGPPLLVQQRLGLREDLPLHGARQEDGDGSTRPQVVVTDAEHARRPGVVFAGERVEFDLVCARGP